MYFTKEKANKLLFITHLVFFIELSHIYIIFKHYMNLSLLVYVFAIVMSVKSIIIIKSIVVYHVFFVYTSQMPYCILFNIMCILFNSNRTYLIIIIIII